MTFGEKIQKLRKEAGLSQEELSDQLDVSRQAISKWERDNGYPETEKLIRMSRIFHVTLDYLLNDENSRPAEGPAEEGVYVSRETADGFLFHQKRKFLKIAAAAGILTGSLSFSFFPSDLFIVLYMMAWVAAIVLLFSVRLADNPYRKLRQEPLLFDKSVKAELAAAYSEKKIFLQSFFLIGIALVALGFLVFPLLVPAEFSRADSVALGAGMAVAGVGAFLCVYPAGILHSYRFLLMRETHQQERKEKSS